MLAPHLVFGQGMKASRPARAITPVSAADREFDNRVDLEDIAKAAGLNFRHVSGDPMLKKFLLEATGGGVAIFDYDGDGLPDIFLVNGTEWKKKPGSAVLTSRLYRNLGGMRFEDVTARAGLIHEGWGQGVCVGDYDNDGREDMFVTYYGHNVLYHNDGDGHFTDVTAKAGIATQEVRWGTGCSFVDYDRDGKLDIAIANYVSFDPKTAPLPGGNAICQFKGLPVVCGPRGLAGGTNQLLHNDGSGHFTDVSHASHFDQPSGHYCYSVISGDFDDDGWPDLFVACDSTPNILLHNNKDGTFSDVAISSGTAFNDNGEEQASMGADAGDYNHSGHESLVVTTFDDDVPALFANEGGSNFSDVHTKAGLDHRTHQVGWGTAWVDLDNSGWLSLFMVNGHVYPNVDSLQRESRYKESSNFYYNKHDGSFADLTEHAGPAITVAGTGRGLAYGDFQNDGSLSLVVNNLDSSPELLVNRAPKGNWLTLKLQGTISNRDAIGAKVLLVAGGMRQTAEVRSGCCYMSQSDLRLHFGLGTAKAVDLLEVTWPNGLRERFTVGNVNRVLSLVEGSAGATGSNSKSPTP